jgi:hypothetical protein
MKVGDLVVRTYGEGQRPWALLVGLHDHASMAEVIWTGSDRIVQCGTYYLEVLSESR